MCSYNNYWWRWNNPNLSVFFANELLARLAYYIILQLLHVNRMDNVPIL